ncbi:hypothetical protein EVAR_75367_1 [Eumeta japonica]|uniref:Uncharacterized protein n=1 Tax=Eumeta variegata TaxID=151549 RepID=A0A4C1Y9X9_EUMVA|nr:hypothetical protein EVAR_75367_1 [Eumeta japonica]
MGGAWERLVKSVKTGLYKVPHEQHPHEKMLYMLLCETEYTVNSRSFTHVSVQIEDAEALTPNHFFCICIWARAVKLLGFTDDDLDKRQH